LRSENAGISKWRKVIAKLCDTPLVGCIASVAGRIGAAKGNSGRVIFAGFFQQEARKNISQK